MPWHIQFLFILSFLIFIFIILLLNILFYSNQPIKFSKNKQKKKISIKIVLYN